VIYPCLFKPNKRPGRITKSKAYVEEEDVEIVSSTVSDPAPEVPPSSSDDTVCFLQLAERLNSIEAFCRNFGKAMAIDDGTEPSTGDQGSSVVDDGKKGKEIKRVMYSSVNLL
jgi:hypothetical protein